jgi:twinkle protein
MREGEIALFISGTGSGKSTLLREIMLHILKTSEARIGVIELEESPAETARKMAGMELSRNPANEEIPLDELKVGFDTVFGKDKVILLDHQGSMKDTSIVDQLEYMALSGCKYLFIDHITILVSEGVDNLQGLEAQDRVMNDLLRIAKRHEVWIGLISHLRKVQVGAQPFEEGRLPTLDDIRGSGSIKQISFDIIAFARNMTAPNVTERNTIKIRVLKSRHTGLTGNTKSAFYEYETGRIVEASEEFKDEEFTQIS